jgi:hypothetical protein
MQSVEQNIDSLRNESRRFIDALATRLGELGELAREADQYKGFDFSFYPAFRRSYDEFMRLAEEFQLLSHVTEETLVELRAARGPRGTEDQRQELDSLDSYFRQLQIPMLREVIQTNFRLLKVWDNRLKQGNGLPYGSKQIFIETLRILQAARRALTRPENAPFLDDQTKETAGRAEDLLLTLREIAPDLVPFDDEEEPLDWGGLPVTVLRRK